MKRARLFMTFTLVFMMLIPSSLFVSAATDEAGLIFDAAKKNYVQLNEKLSAFPTTFEMRIKTAINPGVRQVLFGNYSQTEKSVYSVELTASNQLRYYEVSNGKIIDRSTSGQNITTGEWFTLGVTRDVVAKKVTIYQNGNMVGEFENLELAEVSPQTNLHRIGTDTRNGYFMRAEASEVRLWTTLRTAEELVQYSEVNGDEEGLMHAWKLEAAALSGSVNIINDKAGKINATPVNFERTYETEFTGTGTSFADGQTELAVKDRLSAAPRTVEAWVNVPANTPSSQRVGAILGNYYSASYADISRFNFEINTNGNPRIYWASDKDGEFNYIANNVSVNLGDWVHVAIVLDDINKKSTTYINGEMVHEAPATVAIPNDATSRELKIGSDYRGYSADGAPTMKFNGEIADVRVWSTIRTAEDIKANYNTYLQGNEVGLMGNWKLDSMSDNKYVDSSPAQNHAQIYNNETANWLEPEFAEGDYTIAVIPDTQYLVRKHPEVYKEYMTWIKDNTEKLNLKLAIQVGDLVDTPRSDVEWKTSSEGMRLLDGILPHVFSTGNHDMVINKTAVTRDTAKFNEYYPYEKYSQDSTFGGAFVEGKMDNTYHSLTINDVDYLILAMEFAPNDAVLEWANKVVSDHPDKRVIVTTHSYMYHNGEQISSNHIHYPSSYISDGNNGDDMWNEFVSKHENIILVTSGHIGYDDIVVREDIGVNGNSVKQVLADAQYMQTDLGMIMLMTFKEGSNNVDVNWYSVSKDKMYRTANQFSMDLNIYSDGSTNPNPNQIELAVADQTVSKGSTFTVPVTVSNAGEITGIEGTIQYDKDLLTLESFEFTQFKETGAHNTTVAGKIGFAGVLQTAFGTNENTVIANMVFKAKADIADQREAAITFGNVQAVTANSAGDSVVAPIKASGAKITIVATMPGDINGDQKVDVLDAAAVLKLIVTTPEAGNEAKLAAADVNGDGKVDTEDVLVILQMISDRLAQL